MSSVEVVVEGENGLLYLSAGQVRRFTECENRWLLDKLQDPGLKVPTGQSEAMALGSLIHRLHQAWAARVDWEQEWLRASDEEAGSGFEAPKYFHRAHRIIEKWVEVHGTEPEHPLIAAELPFDLPVPGIQDVWVRGYIDEVVAKKVGKDPRNDDLRAVELKTMGKWGRERQVQWAGDTWLYLWAIRQIMKVSGLTFEAISTFDYKDSDENPARHFRRIEVEWNPEAAELHLDNIRRVANRARQLLHYPNRAVKSVGDQCSWCTHRAACLEPWSV